MKLKGLFMSAAMLAPMAIAPVSTFAAEGDVAQSKVTAEVESGGMTLVAKDADFGELTIGTDPSTAQVTDFLTVTDHTGGNGFTVNVKATNFAETEKTLKTTAHLQHDTVITDKDAVIQTGESLLDVQKFSGSVSGEWGQTPQAGAFSQDLQWTMTANAKPDEGEGEDNANVANLKAIFSEMTDMSRLSASNVMDADGTNLGDMPIMPAEKLFDAETLAVDFTMPGGLGSNVTSFTGGRGSQLFMQALELPEGTPALNTFVSSIKSGNHIGSVNEKDFTFDLEGIDFTVKDGKAEIPFNFTFTDGSTATVTFTITLT